MWINWLLCTFLLLRPANGYELAPQIKLNYAVGSLPGVDNSYEGIFGSIPFELPEQLTGLVDGSFTFLNRSSHFAVGNAFTLEGGLRYLTKKQTAVYGLQAFGDYRHTYARSFLQSGFSFGRFGPVWDVRGNFFYPIGKRGRTLQYAQIAQYDGGYYIKFNDMLWEMRGLELGLARKIKLNRNMLFSPSASAYFMYDNAGEWGYQIQFLFQNLNLWKINLSVSKGNDFGTRVQGFFEISFSSIGRLPYNFVRHALNNPIERLRFVLLNHFDFYRWNW